MGLFNRAPAPTIRTGYGKTDRHLDEVFAGLEAAAQAGQGSYAVSIGWRQAAGRATPAQTVPLYIDHLQRAGYAIQSVVPPATNSGYATVIVDLGGSVVQPSQNDWPTSEFGNPMPIKMIAAFDNGCLYAVHENDVWKSRLIFSDETPDMDLREHSSYKALCVNEGREYGDMMGSVGIVPNEMQDDFSAAFHLAANRHSP